MQALRVRRKVLRLVVLAILLLAAAVVERAWCALPPRTDQKHASTWRRTLSSGTSRRSATQPRDFYLGPFNTSCVRPSFSFSSHFDSSQSTSQFHESNKSVCFSGDGVRVAVLDTGLCRHVAGWSRNVVTCTSVVPGVACHDTGCGHGTRSVSVLAGHLSRPLIAADRPPNAGSRAMGEEHVKMRNTSFSPHHFIGMAPRARLHVLRVFDRDGNTDQRYLTAALDLLLQEADRYRQAPHSSRPPVDIVSLSYGSEDYYINAAVQQRLYRLMRHYGVLVVAAAGNGQRTFGQVRSPADMPGVLGVGALKLIRQHHQAACADHKACSSAAPSAVPSYVEKAVSGFSGRGFTTWELPFGAGRVKPDLVVLGEKVWAVEGVSGAGRQSNSSASSSLRLQLRSVTGTSIAAPIVAGVAALVLEAVRWKAGAFAEDARVPVLPSDTAYWANRVGASLRVRQLLLSTAEPLRPPHISCGDEWRSTRQGDSGSDDFEKGKPTPRYHAELAGLPLARLYARFLSLTKWSIAAQGVGEVQPHRAITHLLYSGEPPPMTLCTCTSFAIPASLVIGGAPFGAADADEGSCATGGGDVTDAGQSVSDLYWWPYADMLAYPGAAPLLFNLSVHLCPNAQLQCPVAKVHNAAVAFDTKYTAQFHLTELIGHSYNLTLRNATVQLFSEDAIGSPARCSRATRCLLDRHLLRVALTLKEVASSERVLESLPAVPPTSFTLSALMYVPPTAYTRLQYCAGAPAVSSISLKASTATFTNDTNNSVSERQSGACLPLFHVFSEVTVRGEVRVRAAHTHPNVSSTSPAPSPPAPLLTIPIVLRIRAPPPLSQRVLVDPSLDWPNPTAASSDLFVAGDDPHEMPGHADAPSAFAEAVGGDHPHTDLALVYVYLRHSLGLAVSVFPLLHVAASVQASASAQDVPLQSASAAAAMLSRVGTLILVDPERPLTRPMRNLLTTAAKPVEGVDGLRVVLVTDWHSAEVAAALRWARETNASETAGQNSSVEASAQIPSSAETPVMDSIDRRERQLLRVWRYNTTRATCSSSEASDTTTASQRGSEGLRGSCHVPSLNRWLDDMATAAVSAQHGRAPSPPPFRLCEDIVMDGVFAVSAGAPAASRDSSSGDADGAFRSLGQLNAAGVLQWSLNQSSMGTLSAKSFSRENSSVSSGEAVMCNVAATWSHTQRRLYKRCIPQCGTVSPSTADDLLCEDAWESFAGESVTEDYPSAIRIDGVAVAPVSSAGAPSSPWSAHPTSLTRGILGFWAFPQKASHRQHPSRVAIFTDSNCFSAADHHVQSALAELDSLLSVASGSSTPAETNAGDPLWKSTAGEQFLRKESAQSSSCVEVMKELLYWTLTGDGQPWREAAQLQCDVRAWPSASATDEVEGGSVCRTRGAEGAAQQSKLKSCETETSEAAAARTLEGEDDDGEDEDDDLLHTAPERARIGAEVVHFWVTTVADPPPNDKDPQDNRSSCLCLLCDIPHGVLRERGTTNSSLTTDEEDSLLWQEHNNLFARTQAIAEQAVLHALSVRYHGNWDAHVRAHQHEAAPDKDMDRRGATADHHFTPVQEKCEGTLFNLRSATMSRGSQDMWQVFYWLRHPVLLTQGVMCLGLLVGYKVYQTHQRRALRRS